MVPPFDRSVFVNCPFDSAFSPILQAVAFCVTDMGFFPRLAPENADNSANRLGRIIDIIKGSKFAIHDLSRCRASAVGEYARMNMPFELGIDHGCQRFGAGVLTEKSVLILEATRYDYQRALSDIAGWDIETHGNDHIRAVRHVRNWLAKHMDMAANGPQRILDRYDDFQGWYWKRELANGASEEDIREYPTIYMIDSMLSWVQAGRPG